MSVSYSSYLVAGVAVADVLKRRTETKQQTKYNVDTGEPHTEEVVTDKCFVGVVDVTDYCRDGMLYLPEPYEYKENLDVLAPFDGFSKAVGCPNEVIGLMIRKVNDDEPITHLGSSDRYPLDEIDERLKHANKILQVFGVDLPACLFLIQEASS